MKENIEGFRFSLKAKDGNLSLISGIYASKHNCQKAIEAVRKHSQDQSRFHRKENEHGNFYFDLKALNGRTLGTSEMYSSEDSRDSAIASVKILAQSAIIDNHIF